MSPRLSTRLSRMLNLVPYFIAHPGISAPAAAAELGVSTADLMTDLNQLWMCGLPGYGPGDLIDLSFSEESIEVTFSAGIERPLRLTSTEAISLGIALRSMLELPGTADPGAARSAMAKIEAAAGAARLDRSVASPEPAPEPNAENRIATTVRAALTDGRALRIMYYSASRDAVSDRTVDPIRVVVVDEHSYLQAWCRQADGVRLFRFDRIDAATALTEPSRPPAAADLTDGTLDLFVGDESLPQAHLRIGSAHAWTLDHYPMSNVSVGADGTIAATMRFATLDWLVRLLLGFGDGVEVLGPPELAAALRTRATAALAAYDLAGADLLGGELTAGHEVSAG
ncbi:helix-turn-helix transcriptional regulator [Skermania piniformis]|uniref:YafY family transcriptional regulator n=1 Tax=Skermania pinensis TaxID=39122 RepID=A0ABX8SEZ5_9ACTN|nr:YafY family protein [Skermania piniformis]QXQ15529.1 YafY family transcriptional regulator [Skermania piniformis]